MDADLSKTVLGGGKGVTLQARTRLQHYTGIAFHCFPSLPIAFPHLTLYPAFSKNSSHYHTNSLVTETHSREICTGIFHSENGGISDDIDIILIAT